jgi:hypothetical protein
VPATSRTDEGLNVEVRPDHTSNKWISNPIISHFLAVRHAHSCQRDTESERLTIQNRKVQPRPTSPGPAAHTGVFAIADSRVLPLGVVR